MATLYQALRLIKTHHYHRLNPHEKGFVKSIQDGLSGMDEVSDQDISDYITPKQEKFIFWIASRFRIHIHKTLFHTLKQKPNLPEVYVKCTHEPETSFKEPLLIKRDTNFSIHTGLGHEFDTLAVADRLATYRVKPPYDRKFQNRPLVVVYGMVNRAGWPIGKLYLEMISSYSSDPEERAKVSAFLTAMNKLDIETEPPAPKPPRVTKKSKEEALPWLF